MYGEQIRAAYEIPASDLEYRLLRDTDGDFNRSTDLYTFHREITDSEHSLMLELLHALDTVCWNAGLDMFIIGGALVGQIFYHGLVPWDDDTDVALHAKHREQLGLELDKLATNSDFQWEKWPKHPDAMFKFFHKGSLSRIVLRIETGRKQIYDKFATTTSIKREIEVLLQTLGPRTCIVVHLQTNDSAFRLKKTHFGPTIEKVCLI